LPQAKKTSYSSLWQTDSRDSDDGRHLDKQNPKHENLAGLSESSDSPVAHSVQKSPSLKYDDKHSSVKHPLAYEEPVTRKRVVSKSVPTTGLDVSGVPMEPRKLLRKSAEQVEPIKAQIEKKLKDKASSVAVRPRFKDRPKRHSYQFDKILPISDELSDKQKKRLSLEGNRQKLSLLSASGGGTILNVPTELKTSTNKQSVPSPPGKLEKISSEAKKREKKPKKESTELASDSIKARDKGRKVTNDRKKEKKIKFGRRKK